MTPPLKGGQGRSARDVEKDSSGIVFSVLLCVAFWAFVIARLCS